MHIRFKASVAIVAMAPFESFPAKLKAALNKGELRGVMRNVLMKTLFSTAANAKCEQRNDPAPEY